MAEQQQQVTEWSQSAKTRMHIFGYIGAFFFLFLEGSRLSYVPAQATSYYFLAPALLVLIGQLPFVIVKRIAKFVDDVSTLPMYMVAVAGFIKGIFELINATGQVSILWAIPVALIAIIVWDIIVLVKDTKATVRILGKKPTAIRQLKILSFVLVYFVVFILAFDVQGIGKPVFWLTPALISLVIALFLEGTIKK